MRVVWRWGLPDGQMGNSEVGHMNIGAGRIVYQDLVKISKAIEDRTLFGNEELKKAFTYVRESGKKLHLIGLLSDGGVHSHIEHVKGLCSAAAEEDLKDVFVHAFTDGRDTDPMAGKRYLEELQRHMDQTTGQIASVTGRYYAMDRDKRWERVRLAYDAMVKGVGTQTDDIASAVQSSYQDGVTDEFIKPIVRTREGQPLALIEEGDVVLCFNFRTDRGRQITQALTQQDFPEHGMHTIKLYYVTMDQLRRYL